MILYIIHRQLFSSEAYKSYFDRRVDDLLTFWTGEQMRFMSDCGDMSELDCGEWIIKVSGKLYGINWSTVTLSWVTNMRKENVSHELWGKLITQDWITSLISYSKDRGFIYI